MLPLLPLWLPLVYRRSPVLPFLPLGLLLVSRQEQRVRPSHQAQHPHPYAAACVSPTTSNRSWVWGTLPLSLRPPLLSLSAALLFLPTIPPSPIISLLSRLPSSESSPTNHRSPYATFPAVSCPTVAFSLPSQPSNSVFHQTSSCPHHPTSSYPLPFPPANPLTRITSFSKKISLPSHWFKTFFVLLRSSLSLLSRQD